MERVKTPYGILEGVTDIVYYKNGNIRSCKLEKYCQVATLMGMMVPQYGAIDTRTRWREALSFYDTGEIKSIYLKTPVSIHSSIGILKGELITFYKEGTVHRLFPLYGQISGYWSEEEEYQLAEKATFKVGDIQVDHKINSYCFYPNGQLKSLSLWKQEILLAKLNKKSIAIRLGVAFYEDGKIKSLEPYVPTMIKTPIGDIMAYDTEPLGIHGDTNSLSIDRSRKIKGITTASTAIQVKSHLGEVKMIMPHLVRSQFDIDKWVIAPITISFTDEQVIFRDEKTTQLFSTNDFEFKTIQIGFEEVGHQCTNCQECNSCS